MSSSIENNLKTKAYIVLKYGQSREFKIQNQDFEPTEFEIITRKYSSDLCCDVSYLRRIYDLCDDIRRSDFYGYSSLLIFTDDVQEYNLRDIAKAIAENPTLTYVTKLIVLDTYWTREEKSYIDPCAYHRPTYTYDSDDEECLTSLIRQPTSDDITYLRRLVNARYEKYGCDCDYEDAKDVFFKRSDIENLTLVYSDDIRAYYTYFQFILDSLSKFAKQNSVQEILDKTSGHGFDERLVSYHHTTNGNYIYNINPALAIIINNQSFFHDIEMNFRESSIQDVKALQRTFKSKKITTLTLIDGSREDIEQVMLKVRTTNFEGIKNLFIVIMSHGDEGDIIYATTGSYSVRDDIVAPLLQNPTLKEVQKFVIVNACRGEIDPRYDDPGEVESARSSQVELSPLYPNDEKLMMIYSTQNGFVSLLFPDKGSLFVQYFCDLFLKNFDEISMEKIGNDLLEIMEENLADLQIPEFVTNDGQSHNIKMEFVNFFNNAALLSDLENFFKKHLNENQHENLDGKCILTKWSYIAWCWLCRLCKRACFNGGTKEIY